MSWLSDLLDRIFKGRRPAPSPPPPPTPPTFDLAALVSQAFNAVNTARKTSSATTVQLSVDLSRVSQEWANRMAGSRILSHGNFSDRIRLVFPNRACGECVSEGQESGLIAVKEFLADPPHRAVLLNPTYTLCGIGVAPSIVQPHWFYWVIDLVA